MLFSQIRIPSNQDHFMFYFNWDLIMLVSVKIQISLQEITITQMSLKYLEYN